MGAAGFLGTYLLQALVEEIPDVQITGVDPRAPESPVPDIKYSKVLVPADVLFHLAGGAGIAASMDNPEADLEANTKLTLQVLEAIRAGRASTMVLASSCAVYGIANGAAREDLPPQPISPYGVSKLAAEHYVRVYHLLHKIDGRIARIGNAYGPGQRRLVVYDLVKRALEQGAPLRLRGDGMEVRDFIHAKDVARGLIAIALRGKPGGVYNVSAGQPLSLLELATMIATAAGLPNESVECSKEQEIGKVREFYPSTERLAGLGFRVSEPIEQGITETVNWVRNEL
jgi:UDP-glucose 4-epimerase